MKLKFAKEYIVDDNVNFSWPKNYIDFVIQEERVDLLKFDYSVPKLYFYTNNKILIVECIRGLPIKSWKEILQSFRKWLLVYSETIDEIKGYMIVWSNPKENQNNLSLNICSNYRESMSQVYFQRNYVCSFTKQNDLWTAGVVNKGGFGEDSSKNFYNLFEPL